MPKYWGWKLIWWKLQQEKIILGFYKDINLFEIDEETTVNTPLDWILSDHLRVSKDSGENEY
jgi:hypothetical protein